MRDNLIGPPCQLVPTDLSWRLTPLIVESNDARYKFKEKGSVGDGSEESKRRIV